jgi:hypothetical protein
MILKVIRFLIYGSMLGLLIFDMMAYSHDHTEMINQHYLSWWTMFLLLDMWFFNSTKDDL